MCVIYRPKYQVYTSANLLHEIVQEKSPPQAPIGFSTDPPPWKCPKFREGGICSVTDRLPKKRSSPTLDWRNAKGNLQLSHTDLIATTCQDDTHYCDAIFHFKRYDVRGLLTLRSLQKRTTFYFDLKLLLRIQTAAWNVSCCLECKLLLGM